MEIVFIPCGDDDPEADEWVLKLAHHFLDTTREIPNHFEQPMASLTFNLDSGYWVLMVSEGTAATTWRSDDSGATWYRHWPVTPRSNEHHALTMEEAVTLL